MKVQAGREANSLSFEKKNGGKAKKDDIISFDVKNKAFARCSSQLSVDLKKSTVLHKLHKLHNFFLSILFGQAKSK